MKPTVCITGANSGFGKFTALTLAANGYQVIATMRNVGKQDELLQEAEQSGIRQCIDVQALDVTNPEQIEETKKYILAQYGRLDNLLCNAGYCAGGPTELLSIEDYKRQFDVNVFGTVQVIQSFLPSMRENRKGKIIIMGSVSGQFGFPGMGAYTSSKFALEGFSESLRLEMAPFNVHVSILEPGAYRTKIWDHGLSNIALEADSPYDHTLQYIYHEAKKAAENAADPQEVADAILRICSAKHPSFRYPLGRGIRSFIFFKNILPWAWIEWFVKKKIQRKK